MTPSPRHPSAEQITRAACAVCGVTPSELAEKGRIPMVTVAREVAVMVARSMTNMSFPEIQAKVLLRPGVSHSAAREAFIRYEKRKDRPLLGSLTTRADLYAKASASLDRELSP